MNYSGIKCPVCEKEFQTDDDIAVCPECGAPHHRECYKKTGHCSMQELHQKKISWENPNLSKSKTGSDEVFCPNCGKSNPIKNDLCDNCQTPLQPQDSVEFSSVGKNQAKNNATELYPTSKGSIDQDKYLDYILKTNGENDLIGDIPAKEFAYYTQQNYFYFLRVFKVICQRTKSLVFNWAACLFTYLYFFYRKMFKIGLAIMALVLVSYIPSILVNIDVMQQFVSSIDFNTIVETMDVATLTNAYVNFVPDMSGLENLQRAGMVLFQIRLFIHLFCGFIANQKYYQQAVGEIKKIKDLLPKNTESSQVENLIAKRGGTNFLIVALLLLIQYLAPVALMIFVIPIQ